MNYHETTLFFPQGTKKRERSHYKYFFNRLVKKSSLSLFRLFRLFFSYESLFFSPKKQHSERERAERENELSFLRCIFPNNKKSSQHDDDERRRDIYILTHTHVTQNTVQYYTARNERRRQDEIPKVLRAVERRTRAR